VIAGRPQQAVHAGAMTVSPLAGLFKIKFITSLDATTMA